MRLKQIEISAELIGQYLTTGHEFRAARVTEGLPEGAKLVALGFFPSDYMVRMSERKLPHTVALIFAHESFPEVEDGLMPEALALTLQTVPPCRACAGEGGTS